jgi:hypothetical protein
LIFLQHTEHNSVVKRDEELTKVREVQEVKEAEKGMGIKAQGSGFEISTGIALS